MLLATLSDQGSFALTLYGIGITAILLFTLLRWAQHPSRIEKERDRYQRELSQCQAECAQLRQQLQQISTDNQNLLRDRDHWQQQHQALSQQLTTLEATYQQLEQNLHRLEQERDRLQHALNQPPDWWHEMTKNYQTWWESLPFLPHEETGSNSSQQ
ncbi:hypothetical protein BRW62_07735 [Parathermosynechococcus lividus PCC 6715]|uniref:Uncharacterized protein n=1 Tax=Parathermosynechococcus lividus PCC 6715 TaxID=1917166 RepID=A0A2D2Q2B0_PARLV|nr:hypothetical protein [Thermostichus lividus]ATS18661.1 hypothetical protein BRW62_07735 [Thermostichus lividus PCC 6715]